VLGDTFVRVDGIEQVAPDVTIVHGVEPGARTVYRVPPEPVPDVTVEVLSKVNDTKVGRRLLEQKRELLGRLGVPLHIELDPERAVLSTWHNVGGELVPGPVTDRFDGDQLGGLHIEMTPGDVLLRLPDGRLFTDGAAEIDRADDAARRADDAVRRADDAARRADRLAEALREAGIEPDAV
jgi:hypothetical protein